MVLHLPCQTGLIHTGEIPFSARKMPCKKTCLRLIAKTIHLLAQTKKNVSVDLLVRMNVK